VREYCSLWDLCGFRCNCVGFIFPKEFEGIHSILDELSLGIEKKYSSKIKAWECGGGATTAPELLPSSLGSGAACHSVRPKPLSTPGSPGPLTFRPFFRVCSLKSYLCSLLDIHT